VFAPHYARPLLRHVGGEGALLLLTPSAESEPVARLVPGDVFAVLEYAGGWAWGYTGEGHLVGYVEAAKLADAA
jgi:hypothetical protein